MAALGWTSTGWTGDWATGWVHTAGNTNVLASTLAAIVANSYLISFVVTGRTAGSFTIAFGGVTSGSQTATNSYSMVASTIGNLQITPTTDFDGEINISIKQVNWQLTQQQLLDLLGVADVVESADLNGYVTVVAGKSLILDTEIARLADVKQNIYTLTLNASADVATRLVGLVAPTNFPTGWTLAADSGVNLLVTHNLTGRNIVDVKVFEVDGGWDSFAKPNEDAYSNFKGNSTSVLIEGLDTLAVPLRIALIFD